MNRGRWYCLSELDRPILALGFRITQLLRRQVNRSVLFRNEDVHVVAGVRQYVLVEARWWIPFCNSSELFRVIRGSLDMVLRPVKSPRLCRVCSI